MVKISIIIPSYNNEKFLPECIESVLVQTFTDFELIIVEGGSKDNSIKIIQKYVEMDNRIHVIIHPYNMGVSKARNDGILASKGEFIAIFDSDDVMLPTRVEELYSEISKDPNYGLAHSDVYVIDEHGAINGKIIGKEQYSKGHICGEVLKRRGCHIGYPIFRKKCLIQTGLYDENLRGGEDYDLYTRITQCFPVAYVQKPLIFYRRHGSNASSKLHLMVSHYKKYLDKTYEYDKENFYGRIKPEAYAHYYIDKMNLDFFENKRNFIVNFPEKLLNFFIKDPMFFLRSIFPFFAIFSLRIDSIARKKIASFFHREYVQIGW
jgi:glycosyltransferase involved in cell wall biosynthesis